MTYSKTVEEFLPASVLQNGDFHVTEGVTDPAQFAWPPYRILWKAMEDLYYDEFDITIANLVVRLEQSGQLGAIALPDGIDISGIGALKYLSALELEGGSTEELSRKLQGISAKRQLGDLGSWVEEMALDPDKTPEDLLAKWDIEAGKIALATGAKSKAIATLNVASALLKKTFEDAVEFGSQYIETGLKAWDEPVGGIYGGRVYIVAGTSGSGKSTLVQNIMRTVSLVGGIITVRGEQELKKGGIFSLEMSKEELAARFIQMETGIGQINIEKGNVDREDLGKLKQAFKNLFNEQIIIDDTQEVTLPQLRANIRRMVAMGVKYVVIDQLDMVMIGGGMDGRNYNEGNLKTYRIKAFAREFDIPIILCHQLNKSTDNVKRKNVLDVSLADLANSGQNAVDAIVFARHNDKINALVWEKVRQGVKGVKYVLFDLLFITYTDDERQDYQISGDDEEST